MKAVSIESIEKTFRVGFMRRKVRAVDSVSFEVEEGEVFGVVGPNGAGKTTTIKMLTGLVRPDSGRIEVFGKSVDTADTKKTVGYLPENPYFYEHLRIEELLRFYGQLFGISRTILNHRIPILIELVGLSDALDRRLSKFSKGMRQRAGIAQALINDPKLVILDEPQTGLDPFGRRDVRNLILDLKRQGKTVIFSSHILPDVEAVCDRVVLMKAGSVLTVGSLKELTGDRVKAYEVIATRVLTVPECVSHYQVQAGTHIMEVDTDSHLSECIRLLVSSGSQIISVSPRKVDLEDILVKSNGLR
jgi:ABC-2 type transport system ATP-binding protein